MDQIDGDAALGRVERQEQAAAFAVAFVLTLERAAAARDVADARRLDLDDFRAQIAHQLGGIGRGDIFTAVDYLEARKHGVLRVKHIDIPSRPPHAGWGGWSANTALPDANCTEASQGGRRFSSAAPAPIDIP